MTPIQGMTGSQTRRRDDTADSVEDVVAEHKPKDLKPVDDLLDEIDAELAKMGEAEDFVLGFIQKSGE